MIRGSGQESGCQFVFSDGHGLAAFTDWYDDLEELVDWTSSKRFTGPTSQVKTRTPREAPAACRPELVALMTPEILLDGLAFPECPR